MSWFSRRPKTIEVETRNEDGTVTKRRVPEAAFHSAIDKLVAAGKAEVLDACIAHILEVGRGEYTANWVVDEDIPRATYDRFVTGGHVYVSIHYEEGLPKTSVLKKSFGKYYEAVWQRSMRRLMRSMRPINHFSLMKRHNE